MRRQSTKLVQDVFNCHTNENPYTNCNADHNQHSHVNSHALCGHLARRRESARRGNPSRHCRCVDDTIWNQHRCHSCFYIVHCWTCLQHHDRSERGLCLPGGQARRLHPHRYQGRRCGRSPRAGDCQWQPTDSRAGVAGDADTAEGLFVTGEQRMMCCQYERVIV